MKKIMLGVIIMGIISMLTGCGSVNRTPITIDYAEYPKNFMIQLQPNQKYILKNGNSNIDFSAVTKSLFKKSRILTYGELTHDISHNVYYRKTEPVLIHYNSKDYIWVCEEEENGILTGAAFYYLSEYNSLNGDNGTVNLTIGSEILDPDDFIMNKSSNCFGSAVSTVHYRINELGKPEEIPTDDEFYYIDAPYSEEVLCLDEDINTWIYANADATEPTVEVIPAGTTFRRFRIPKNAEYSYVEGILEDGRVMRVIEEYWFSEPSAYQAMLDKDAQQFTYSSSTSK